MNLHLFKEQHIIDVCKITTGQKIDNEITSQVAVPIKNGDYIVLITPESKIFWNFAFKMFGIKLNVKYITQEKLLKGEIDNMGFKYIPGNPPYDGVSQLHQQILNKCVNLLEKDGQLKFIQPAYPYQYNKEKDFIHNSIMIENIKKYKTTVTIVPGTTFKDAKIITDLAITKLTKTEVNSGVIEEITYKNKDTYTNVKVEDVCMNGINPDTFHTIKLKFDTILNQNGSILELAKLKPEDGYISIAELRGNINTTTGELKADFFTLYSSVDRKKTSNIKYGLKCVSGQEDNMYAYLDSKVARYGLSIYKLNNHNNRGEIKMIPIVDFSRKYSDAELYKLFELTEQEILEIEKVIVDYNGVSDD